jgi:hypothetical protein
MASTVESCLWTKEDYDEEVDPDENGCNDFLPTLTSQLNRPNVWCEGYLPNSDLAPQSRRSKASDKMVNIMRMAYCSGALTPRVLPADIELTYQLILPARSCRKYKSFTIDAATASDALPPNAAMIFDHSKLLKLCAVAPQM